MKCLLTCMFVALLAFANEARAIDRVVTIEGPVRIMKEPGSETSYWVEDSKQVKYKVFMTEPERARFTTVIEKTPTAVIRFDGTVVDDEAAAHTFRVTRWETVTNTSKSITDDGQTVTTTEERNTTVRPTR